MTKLKTQNLRPSAVRRRWLKSLRELGGCLCSAEEAAARLGLADGQALLDLFVGDQEARAIWDEARLIVFKKCRNSLQRAAERGNIFALRTLSDIFCEKPGDPLRAAKARLVMLEVRRLSGESLSRETLRSTLPKVLNLTSTQIQSLNDFLKGDKL